MDENNKNAEGYADPTAEKAIKKVDSEDKRFHMLLRTFFNICELSGFHIEEHIVILDKRTGKVWR